MNAFARTTIPVVALAVAIVAASAPALAMHRSISISNHSSKEIHMQVVSKTPDGVANVWSGMLDKPLGAHPNGAGVDFEDHGQPFQVIFSGSGCNISTEIDPHRTVHSVSIKNCVVIVR